MFRIFFRALDGVPLLEHGAGVARLGVAKNMRMPPNKFVTNVSGHVFDREAAFFTRDLGVDHHLQKQIAEFFAQIRIVAFPDRVRDFVSFLEQARNESWRAFVRDPRDNHPARGAGA